MALLLRLEHLLYFKSTAISSTVFLRIAKRNNPEQKYAKTPRAARREEKKKTVIVFPLSNITATLTATGRCGAHYGCGLIIINH